MAKHAPIGRGLAYSLDGRFAVPGVGVRQVRAPSVPWSALHGTNAMNRKPAKIPLVVLLAAFLASVVQIRAETTPSSETNNLAALTARAEKGDAEAQFELGTNLLKSDEALAQTWLSRAAEHGSAGAQTQLGLLYLVGIGVVRDSAESVKWFRKAADQGDVEAQDLLGALYAAGRVVPQDYTEAVRWYHKAAEQGYAPAEADLAHCYEDGHGTPQNKSEAAHWYRKAAEHGDADAQYNLGFCYWTGKGVERDLAEAAKWFRKAADQGSADAQSLLGTSYEAGYGVPKDHSEAAHWFRKAAESYRKAAERGDAFAQGSLGRMYADGEGVTQDYLEAVKWLRKAADQGDVEGEFMLGECYNEGHGVPQDYSEALNWYRKAAKQGHPSAKNRIGTMYSRGNGLPQDYIEAYKWYNLAASDGDTEAAERRGELTPLMTPDQIAEGQRRSSAFVSGEATESTQSTGTAFFITENGYMLTCAHVVEDATRIEITLGDKHLRARLVKADMANDVAILKVTGSFKALPLTASRGAKLGDSIFTIGFPNTAVQGTEPKLTKGEISSLAGVQDDPRQFQISAPIQPGNSGGPLVDANGNVIGIVAARLGDIATLKLTGSLPQNVNYALKSSFIMALLESLPEISANLKSPHPASSRPFSEVADEVRLSVALVTVY